MLGSSMYFQVYKVNIAQSFNFIDENNFTMAIHNLRDHFACIITHRSSLYNKIISKFKRMFKLGYYRQILLSGVVATN